MIFNDYEVLSLGDNSVSIESPGSPPDENTLENKSTVGDVVRLDLPGSSLDENSMDNASIDTDVAPETPVLLDPPGSPLGHLRGSIFPAPTTRASPTRKGCMPWRKHPILIWIQNTWTKISFPERSLWGPWETL